MNEDAARRLRPSGPRVRERSVRALKLLLTVLMLRAACAGGDACRVGKGRPPTGGAGVVLEWEAAQTKVGESLRFGRRRRRLANRNQDRSGEFFGVLGSDKGAGFSFLFS